MSRKLTEVPSEASDHLVIGAQRKKGRYLERVNVCERITGPKNKM